MMFGNGQNEEKVCMDMYWENVCYGELSKFLYEWEKCLVVGRFLPRFFEKPLKTLFRIYSMAQSENRFG